MRSKSAKLRSSNNDLIKNLPAALLFVKIKDDFVVIIVINEINEVVRNSINNHVIGVISNLA